MSARRMKVAFSRMVLASLTVIGICVQLSAGQIHDAVRAGDIAKVTSLLAADPSLVNAKDGGITPLLYAIHFGKLDVARFLLQKGADVNALTSNGVGPLYEAAGQGQTEIVRLLLEKGAMVNAKTETACTPLLIGSAMGQLDIVKLLLAKGADVNAQASYNTIHESASPLIDATKVNADFESLGGGPLEGKRAASPDKKRGFLDVVKILLNNGAKTDITDNFGHTALYYASKNGQLEVVRLLLDKGAGADVQGHNRNGTPLLLAAQNGDIEIVKLLLAKGADPNAETNEVAGGGKRWTPITIAEANGFTSVVALLRQAQKIP